MARRRSEVYMNCDDWDNLCKTFAKNHIQDILKERRRMDMYFRRQRFYGGVAFIVGAILIIVGYCLNMPMLRGLGLAAGLVGLYLFITKAMVITDEYYFECQSRLMIL